MTTNKLWKYTTNILVTLCSVAMFLSCGDDKGTEPPQTEPTTGEWYVYDDNLSEYISEIKTACNNNSANYYAYIDNDGTLKSAGSNFGIQIINGNTLQYWYFNYGILGGKQSNNSQYYLTTQHTIQSDRVICYSTYSKTYTYVEGEGKIIVSNGDIYTKNSNGLIVDGGSAPLKKKQVLNSDFSKKKQVATDCQDKNKVSASITYDYKEFACGVAFTSSLRSIYPNESFMYGAEYGMKEYNNIIESDSQDSFIIPIDGRGEYFMFYGSLQALQKKIDSGQTLTKNERDLYVSLMHSFDESREAAKRDFVVRCYVRYGGVKYYIQ